MFGQFLFILCLTSLQGGTWGCNENLVADFFDFSDGLLTLTAKCMTLDARYNTLIEDVFGFPSTSYRHWRNLLCAVSNAESFNDLEEAVNSQSEDPVSSYEIRDVINNLSLVDEYGALYLSHVEKYHHKIQPWLNKTNFPHDWPVQNTGKKETARLMAKGEYQRTSFNLLTFDGVNHDASYRKWAKSLLQAQSLEEYLAVVDDTLLVDHENLLPCYLNLQDIFRDSDTFSALPATAHALFRVVTHLKEMGIFDMHFKLE